MLGLQDYREWILLAGLLLGALAVFGVVFLLLSETESLSTQDSLDEMDGRRGPEDPFFKILKPFIRNYLVPAIRAKPKLDAQRVIYRRLVISGGQKGNITADEVIGFKLLLTLAFPMIGAILNAAKVFQFDSIFLVGLAAVGFVYPDSWLKGQIKKRHKSVLKTLPFVVDLLALSTEAGLDFIGAIQKVVEKGKRGPLIEELEQVLKDIQLGSPRGTALREMAIRLNLKETSSFVSVLIAAEQMGAPVGKVLRQQSEQVRVERFLRAEKAGGSAAAKLLIPMVPILLAIMAIIFGSFAAQLYGSGASL